MFRQDKWVAELPTAGGWKPIGSFKTQEAAMLAVRRAVGDLSDE